MGTLPPAYSSLFPDDKKWPKYISQHWCQKTLDDTKELILWIVSKQDSNKTINRAQRSILISVWEENAILIIVVGRKMDDHQSFKIWPDHKEDNSIMTGSDHFGFLIYVSWKMMGWVLVMAGVLLALRCLRMWLLRWGRLYCIAYFRVDFKDFSNYFHCNWKLWTKDG